MYKVYSKENCPFCKRTINALLTFELPFVEYKLGEDFTREDFIEKFEKYNHKTFPAIYKDGTFVGGWEEFKKVIF